MSVLPGLAAGKLVDSGKNIRPNHSLVCSTRYISHWLIHYRLTHPTGTMGIFDYVSDLYAAMTVQEAYAEEPQKDDGKENIHRRTALLARPITCRVINTSARADDHA